MDKLQKVFVVDVNGKPLLPCHPARARKLLKSGRAKVKRMLPFTIQLEKEVEEPVGEFSVGIDEGSAYVGIAVVNNSTKEVVFQGTLKLRQDVRRKVQQRAMYRRSRRGRKVRGRKARFMNRKQFTPFPTIRQKRDSIYRVVCDFASLVNITDCIIEEVSVKIVPKESVKGNACVVCGVMDNLQGHHLWQRAHGGSNAVQNIVKLCVDCHKEVHSGGIELERKGIGFQWQTHAIQGKKYLRGLLEALGFTVTVVHGFQTAQWRERLHLEKSHSNDAVTIVCVDTLPKLASWEWVITPKRRREWQNNPTKTCVEKNGFRHWDVVRATRAGRTVIGTVRSLKKKGIALRIPGDSNYDVSYNKSKVIWKFGGMVYLPQM